MNAAVPPELDRIVMKALEIDPARRYQTAGAMAADLERALIAARYSSQNLSKLLAGLFLTPEEPRVVVAGQAGSGAAAQAPAAGHPASPTDRMRAVRVTPAAPDVVRAADDGDAAAERTRLVWQSRRARVKLAIGAAALAIALGVGALAARNASPASPSPRSAGRGR
jgi:hypothetical protein